MHSTTTRIWIGLAMITTLGCGGAQQIETESAANASTGSEESAQRLGGSRSGAQDNASCNVAPVYFAYDSSDLDARAREAAASNAACVSRRAAHARVTGMTDPRGTEEYNLALGDRRARSVTSYMSNLGVDSGSVDIRSVGEELAAGEDESSWSRDRRADVEVR